MTNPIAMMRPFEGRRIVKNAMKAKRRTANAYGPVNAKNAGRSEQRACLSITEEN